MKDWTKLTEEELASLDNKQVETYKKLLYAENGIKLLEKPCEPEQLKEPCDMTIYYVKGISSSYGDNWGFASLDEAKDFIEYLKKCKSLGHTESNDKCGYNNKYFEPGLKETYGWYDKESPFTIITKEVYSKEKFLQMQSQMVAYENLKKVYDKDKKEWDANHTAAIEVTKDFYDALNEARNNIRRKKMLTNMFYNDYLPVAESNEDMAMTFLRKAYPTITDADEQYIRTHQPTPDKGCDDSYKEESCD